MILEEGLELLLDLDLREAAGLRQKQPVLRPQDGLTLAATHCISEVKNIIKFDSD